MIRHSRVRYGVGVIDEIAPLISEWEARRVFLVCGRRSFEASGAARALPQLQAAAEVCRWSDFSPNADAHDLIRGLKLMRDFRPDLILGVGGGSAMDMAKLLCAYEGVLDEAALLAAIRSGRRITEREVGLVLAPTTSGSGSEATHFAAVYIGDEKFSVAGDPLRPDLVFLDPALSLSSSRYQRATSGIDAVAQAIESLWAVGATDRSRRWARHALRHLLPAIERFVNHSDETSARAMSIGSHLAGRAIDISKTTAAHALSYGITKRHGLNHGHAVAVTLKAFLRAHGEAIHVDSRLRVPRDELSAAMIDILDALGAATPADAQQRFAALCARIGLVMDFAEVGIADPAEIEALASLVNAERLGNNPVTLSQGQLVELLASC